MENKYTLYKVQNTSGQTKLSHIICRQSNHVPTASHFSRSSSETNLNPRTKPTQNNRRGNSVILRKDYWQNMFIFWILRCQFKTDWTDVSHISGGAASQRLSVRVTGTLVKIQSNSHNHSTIFNFSTNNMSAGQRSLYSDWLQAGRSGDLIPVVARFPALVQTNPGAHPASCTMGTGSFPGVKSGRGVILTPHPLLVPLVMKQQSYTSTPPMGRTACTEPLCLYKGDLYLYLLSLATMYKKYPYISNYHPLGCCSPVGWQKLTGNLDYPAASIFNINSHLKPRSPYTDPLSHYHTSEPFKNNHKLRFHLTFWHRSFTFKFQHTLYVKSE